MSNPEVHAAAVGANNADVANGNITDNNIRRAFDGLRKFLDEKVPKPALLVRLWDKYADLLWFAGLFSSLIVFLYAAEESSKLFKIIGVLIVFVFWVLLAVWISKRNKHKQMNVTAKRYKVLHYLLLDVFEAFGWLGEGDISMACRNGVTPVHILDLNRWLDASERSRWLCDDLGFESHGHQYDLDHLHFLSLKNDWPKRIALLCKKVKKAAEEYYAIEDSVAVAADLLAIAEALQDNSVDGLAKAAAANKERDRLVAKLPIQHEVDNIMIPHIDNGLSLHKAAVLVGQLQGIAEQVSLLHKAVEPQLHLPGLLQENGKGDLVPNVERPPQHSGGMEKS